MPRILCRRRSGCCALRKRMEHLLATSSATASRIRNSIYSLRLRPMHFGVIGIKVHGHHPLLHALYGSICQNARQSTRNPCTLRLHTPKCTAIASYSVHFVVPSIKVRGYRPLLHALCGSICQSAPPAIPDSRTLQARTSKCTDATSCFVHLAGLGNKAHNVLQVQRVHIDRSRRIESLGFKTR